MAIKPEIIPRLQYVPVPQSTGSLVACSSSVNHVTHWPNQNGFPTGAEDSHYVYSSR